MTEAANLYVGVGGDVTVVVNALRQVQDQLKNTANQAGQTGRNMKESANIGKMAWTELNSAIGVFRTAMQTAQEVYRATIGEWVAWGAQVTDMQYQLGGTAEELSSFAGAAKLVNTDVGEISMTLRYLETQTGQLKSDLEAGKGASSEFGKALKDMGIDARSFVDLGFNDQVAAIADGLLRLDAGAERTAAGAATLSRGFYGMTDLLEGGAAGLKDLEEKARDAGLVMDQQSAEMAESAEKAVFRINAAWSGMKMQAFGGEGGFLEDLANFMEYLASKGQFAAEMTAQMDELRQASRMLAGEFPNLAKQVEQLNYDAEFFNYDGAAYANRLTNIAQSAGVTVPQLLQMVYANRQNTEAMRWAKGAAAGLPSTFMAVGGAARNAAGGIDAATSAAARYASVGRRLAGLRGNMALYEANYGEEEGGGGGGGSDTARMQRQWEQERVNDALQAGYDISQAHREMNDRIDDNEAGLTEEQKAEFKARTEAAWQEALKVKDNEGQLARDLLSIEDDYQRQKAEILTDTSLSDEERQKRLQQLDRDNAQAVGDAQEQARIDAEIKKRQREQELADARETGTTIGKAAGEAMLEENRKTAHEIYLERRKADEQYYREAKPTHEQGAVDAEVSWSTFFTDYGAAQDSILAKWGLINQAASTTPARGGSSSSWDTGGPAVPAPTTGGGGGGRGPTSVTVNQYGPVYASTPQAAEESGAGVGRGINQAMHAEGMN